MVFSDIIVARSIGRGEGRLGCPISSCPCLALIYLIARPSIVDALRCPRLRARCRLGRESERPTASPNASRLRRSVPLPAEARSAPGGCARDPTRAPPAISRAAARAAGCSRACPSPGHPPRPTARPNDEPVERTRRADPGPQTPPANLLDRGEVRPPQRRMQVGAEPRRRFLELAGTEHRHHPTPDRARERIAAKRAAPVPPLEHPEDLLVGDDRGQRHDPPGERLAQDRMSW